MREFYDASGKDRIDTERQMAHTYSGWRHDHRFAPHEDYEACLSYFYDSMACQEKHGENAPICRWFIIRKNHCHTQVVCLFLID